MSDRLAAALANVTRVGEPPTPDEADVIAQAKSDYERGIYWTLDLATGETVPSPEARAMTDPDLARASE